MNRKQFYDHLDQLTEAWYIDTTKLDFEVEGGPKSGKTRALRYRDVPVEEMHRAIEANSNNPTGFPIIERWKHHKNKPEIFRIDKVDK